jgi:hypothetical protein
MVHVAVAVPAVTVMVPLRGPVVVLAAALMLITLPEVPLGVSSVSQSAPVVTTPFQDGWLVVTVMPIFIPAVRTWVDDADNDTVGVAAAPAWLMVRVAVLPPAVTVMVPLRGPVVVLAAANTETVPPEVPLAVTIDSQLVPVVTAAVQEGWLVVTVVETV